MSEHDKQKLEKFLMPWINGFKKMEQDHRAYRRQKRQERSMTTKVPEEGEQEQFKNAQQNDASNAQQSDQAKNSNDQSAQHAIQMNQSQQISSHSQNLLQSTYYKGPPMAQMPNQQNNNQQLAQNITQSAHYPSHQCQNNQIQENEQCLEGFTVFKTNTKKGKPALQESEIYSSHFSQSVTDISKSAPINPHSRVLVLKSDALEFALLDEDDKSVENKSFVVDEVNNLKIIREQKSNPPEYKFQERICENHGQGINYICREEACIKNSQQLLCPKCLREHKGHNFLDIEEALNLIEVEQKQNSLGQQMIDRIEMNFAKDFKIIKQKVQQDLNNIEYLLTEACNCLRGQLQYKVREYQIRFANILDGGLSKLYEAVTQVFMENSNLQLLDMKEFEQKIKQYNELIALYQPKEEIIQVKCDNLFLNISKEKIINMNALAEQIEFALLLQHKKLQIDKDYLLINENKAIKLKGNPNQVQEQYLEVISIAKIQ